MLTRREIQLDLLRKLNELCEKANVNYVLHGQAAFLAYRNEPIDDLNSLEVMMCQGDAEKIVELLDDDKFYFEDFRSNPKFDKHFMIFGYKNSLDLKVRDLNFMKTRHIQNHCIRINIRFIEHPVATGMAKSLRLKRLIWKFRNLNITTEYLWYFNYIKKILNIIYKIIGEENAIKRRYELKKKHFSIWTWDEIKNYPIVKISGISGVKSKLFDDIITKELDGVQSFIFNDFKQYGFYFYGNNWEKKTWKSVKGYSSSLISWQDYINDPDVKKSLDVIQKHYEYTYAKSSNLQENKYLKKIKGIVFPKSNEMYNNKLIILNMRKNVKQSGSIIHTRENFIKQKEELIWLYNNKNYDELEIRLKPLIQSMQNGIHIGYSYSVDSEIDELLDSYLRDIGRNELADKIQYYRIDV